MQETMGTGLRIEALAGGLLIVQFRQGGERFRPMDRAHSQELKKLLQQAGIPPWERDRLPLLYLPLSPTLPHQGGGGYPPVGSNHPGAARHPSLDKEGKKAQYQATINASLTTAFATVRAAGKYMKNGGSVVLVSSAAAMTGLANHEAIAAAKAGIIGLTLAAAASYAGNHLRFNAVASGLTETPLTQSLTANETSRRLSEAMHALGRLGQPADIARAIVFLLDPANSWITGQVLAVDGGLSRVRPRMKA